MTIAGVPVGGVNPQIASERVLQVYSTPIEVQYGEAIIHVDPSLVGFELDMDSMMAAADLERTGGSFWGGFWNYLWNRDPNPVEVPLKLRRLPKTVYGPTFKTRFPPATMNLPLQHSQFPAAHHFRPALRASYSMWNVPSA